MDALYGERWDLSTDLFQWRGTRGISDLMMGLNTAHQISHTLKKPITLQFNWNYDQKFLYHDDDKETILDRLNFLNSKLLKTEKLKVHISHAFNTKETFSGDMMKGLNKQWIDGTPYKGRRVQTPRGINSWRFDKIENKDNNKVVFWTWDKNIENPSWWQRSYDADWQQRHIYDVLDRKGFELVEVSYRDSVEDVYNEIKNAGICIGYCGVWQYLARNHYVPSVILSNGQIVRTHNPHAKIFHGQKIDKEQTKKFFLNIEDNMRLLISILRNYRNKLETRIIS